MGKQLRQERRGVKTSAALQRKSLDRQIKQIKQGGISFGQYDLLGESVVEGMFE